MLELLKTISKQNECKSNGVCSIHPSVNALNQLLIEEVREISFYSVKLKEFNIINNEITEMSLAALSIFMVNTNYNKNDYLNFLYELYLAKENLKEKYLNYCENYKLPCEIINSDFKIERDMDISQLIEYSQNIIEKKQKSCDKSKINLFDLITLYSKLASILVLKIKRFNKDFNKYDYEILRFFSLTNGYSIRNEKIKRRIFEFIDIYKEMENDLNLVYQKEFGAIENATISADLKEGYSILVSGDDLYELSKLLDYIEKLNPEEKINVYTHGAMIKAHFYPYFKNNKYLVGHYGTDNAEYDFLSFDGAIYLTRNFVQKIDALYRGEIFSSKIISLNKIPRILNYDYSNLISATLKTKYYFDNGNIKKTTINYDVNYITNTIEKFNANEIILVLDGAQDTFLIKTYKNKEVMFVNCPFENELLTKTVNNFKEKNIKITLFLANCNLTNFNALLNLLNMDLDIYLTNCSDLLINPHIIESLKCDFKIKTL